MSKRIVLLTLLVFILLILSGCFPGSDRYGYDDRAGFFSGIWHGWIATISLIVGLFDSSVRIYETNNTGWWYDLGFYMAVISGFGGVAFTRKRKAEAAYNRG